MAEKLTKSRIAKWHRRAETIFEKARSLFVDMDESLGGDHELVGFASGALTSAVELANTLEGELCAAIAKLRETQGGEL